MNGTLRALRDRALLLVGCAALVALDVDGLRFEREGVVQLRRSKTHQEGVAAMTRALSDEQAGSSRGAS